MKAITVKYIGPSNVRGSRLKAFDCDGNQITISYDDGLNRDELYRKAAYAFRDKMGWKGEMVCGGTKEGEVFVFLPYGWPMQTEVEKLRVQRNQLIAAAKLALEKCPFPVGAMKAKAALMQALALAGGGQ